MSKKFSLEIKVVFAAVLVLLILLTVNVLSAVYGEKANGEGKKFIVSDNVRQE